MVREDKEQEGFSEELIEQLTPGEFLTLIFMKDGLKAEEIVNYLKVNKSTVYRYMRGVKNKQANILKKGEENG